MTVTLVHVRLQGLAADTALREGPPLLRELRHATRPILATQAEAREVKSELDDQEGDGILLQTPAHRLVGRWEFPYEPVIRIDLDESFFATAGPVRGSPEQTWLIDWHEGDGGALQLIPLADLLPEEIDPDPAMRAFAIETALRAATERLLHRRRVVR